jgi:hypothetical protein
MPRAKKISKKNEAPAHEADRLALEIEKDASLIKKFGYRGSFAVLFFSVFLLIGLALYGLLVVTTGGNVALKSEQADAAFSWTNRGAPATISGYKTAPATPTTQTDPSICPVGLTVVSKTNLAVGESATVHAPSGWREETGSFHTTNPNVLSVSGNTITALAPGNAQVYGNDFTVTRAWPCISDAVSVTVGQSAPAPQVQAFIGGYHIISNCGSRSATITAVSPVAAKIYFDGLRNERGATGGSYSGPQSTDLSKQADGSYRGSISVSTRNFGAGLAAIFRLTGYSGYAAVSHDYDESCS